MVVATGFFDGVHLGHRFVLSRLVEEARRRGEESTVVTFWPHPRTVLQSGARDLRLLSSLEEKKEILHSLGIDRVEVLPFSKDFARMTAEEYLREVVCGRLGGTSLVVGYDNRVGSDQKGAGELAEIASGLGLECIVLDKVASGDVTVSSTKIRGLLSDGKVEEAGRMLGYRYRLHGVVVAGNRLGRTIGFPTANMELYEPLKAVPGRGAYAVDVEVLGRSYMGMTSVGSRPTVSSSGDVTIETNIFGFDEDIYGLDIEVAFRRKIRDERRFPTLDALREQLASDRQEAMASGRSD